jgi:hypothetical protein
MKRNVTHNKRIKQMSKRQINKDIKSICIQTPQATYDKLVAAFNKTTHKTLKDYLIAVIENLDREAK